MSASALHPLLDRIVSGRRAQANLRKTPIAELREAAMTLPPAMGIGARAACVSALRSGSSGPFVIAEFKRKSPSAGWLLPNGDPVAIARAYVQAGARMISVLTEGPHFAGSLSDLQKVAASVPVPVLRKDFLLDEYDLLESRLSGATCVLLIVRILEEPELALLIEQAHNLGLATLVEAHSIEEAYLAKELGAEIIGINHRDLRTLSMDLRLSEGVREALGKGPLLVAESGLKSPTDLKLMKERGIDAVLVGESLLRSKDPGAALILLRQGV